MTLQCAATCGSAPQFEFACCDSHESRFCPQTYIIFCCILVPSSIYALITSIFRKRLHEQVYGKNSKTRDILQADTQIKVDEILWISRFLFSYFFLETIWAAATAYLYSQSRCPSMEFQCNQTADTIAQAQYGKLHRYIYIFHTLGEGSMLIAYAHINIFLEDKILAFHKNRQIRKRIALTGDNNGANNGTGGLPNSD